MGLASDTRIRGIYNSLARLDEQLARQGILGDEARVMADSYRLKPLLMSAKQLWPTFLRETAHEMAYLVGLDTDNPVIAEELDRGLTTPLHLVIGSQLRKIGREIKEDQEDSVIVRRRLSRDPVFDAKEYVSIPYLLRHVYNEKVQSDIAIAFDIYQEVRATVYYLRRHNDDFRLRLKEFDDLLGQIMGLCYGIFRENDELLAKAYCIVRIMEFIYRMSYPYCQDEWDPVTEFAAQFCLHHDFANLIKHERLDGKTLKELSSFHLRLAQPYELFMKKFNDSTVGLPDVPPVEQQLVNCPAFLRARTEIVLECCPSAFEKDARKQAVKLAKTAKIPQKQFQQLAKVHEDSSKQPKDLDRSSEVEIYGYEFTPETTRKINVRRLAAKRPESEKLPANGTPAKRKPRRKKKIAKK